MKEGANMSSMSARHREMLEYLFDMQGGYLLRFTNDSFRRFMILHADIDVYNASGYDEEPSKAKKFRYFLSNEPDALVGQIILELLQMRSAHIERMRLEDDEYIDSYSEYATEIEKVARAMCAGAAVPRNNQERLNATLLCASNVLQDLFSVCESACNNRTYNYGRSENEINDYFRDMLGAKGYSQVLDQTRHGISMNGNDAGEVDILLKKDDKEAAIIEGLKLDCVNQNYIKNHIDKAVVNYNALGTATFIVAYVGVADFQSFWNGVYTYLKAFSYPLEVKRSVEEMAHTSAAVRCANTILSRDGYDFPVYFIAVNIGRG